MYDLYEKIEVLCRERGVKVGKMCADIGMYRSMMSDLKNGRKNKLEASTLQKIADYFGVSVDYLISEDKKAPSAFGGGMNDAQLKFALWGTTDITDEILEDVRRFAKFAEEQEKLGEKRKDDKRPE